MYITESDGITITASEVYCDGLSIFLTAEVNIEQGGLDHISGNLLYLEGSCKLAGDNEEKKLVNNNLEGKVIDNQTFVGMLKLNLDEYRMTLVLPMKNMWRRWENLMRQTVH